MSKSPAYERPAAELLAKRLREPRRFIEVVAGPRQVGKTTAVLQVLRKLGLPSHYATADEPVLREPLWIDQQWEVARGKAGSHGAILVLDEIQKVKGWSEAVKKLWDQDTRRHLDLRVAVLGSAPLLIERGLVESLAGRFELVAMPHWSFAEMRAAFGWDLEQFILHGGYPGSAGLIDDHERWARYILDSLVETTISRDVVLMTRVDKPALLRRLFELGCHYSGQILSYNKMLGQLADAGNTTTLAHYLELLAGAGLVSGVFKFPRRAHVGRSSSPKLVARNTALITAVSRRRPDEIRKNPELWGRWVETAAGAHLINASMGGLAEVFYWRDPKGREVDYVLARGARSVGLEVKSGHNKGVLTGGLVQFTKEFRPHRTIVVGSGGIELEEFFLTPPDQWLA